MNETQTNTNTPISENTPKKSGSKTVIIILVVIVILAAAGAAAYFYLWPKEETSNNSNTAVSNNNINEQIEVNTSLSTNSVNNNLNINTNARINTNQSLDISKLPAKPEPVSTWTWVVKPEYGYTERPKNKEEALANCNLDYSDFSDENWCYMGAAGGFRYPEACEWVELVDTDTEPFMNIASCYAGIMMNYGVFDCSTITSQPYRDSCYYAAVTLNDQTYKDIITCDTIEDSTIKDSCNEFVENFKYIADLGLGDVFSSASLAVCRYPVHPDKVNELPEGLIRDFFSLLIQYRETQGIFDCSNLQAEDDTESTNNNVDGDELINAIEIYFGSDPTKSDSDGDGYSDYEEIISGYDPENANETAKLPLSEMYSRLQQDMASIK